MSAARYLPFVGRLLIGLPFLMSGVGKIMAYGATTAYIKSSTLPLPAPFAYMGAVAVEVGCGLFIIGGYRTRVVAAILALFCLTTAVFFHTHFSDPNQTFHFIKNLVMAGGLLQIVTFGAGAFSIDGRRSNDGLSAAAPQGAKRVEHEGRRGSTAASSAVSVQGRAQCPMCSA